jgi:peptidoglycan/LPS O-acetylase OafA/YrhL
VQRTFYPHVEGLRGVAALYVFLFHVWQAGIEHPATATLALLFGATWWLLQYGHFAVAAFIVISGFCLALPVAASGTLRFDPKDFFVRRARRLMPAYVAVVFLSILPWCITALLEGQRISPPHIALATLMHLALIHNLFYATTEYLNGPLWTIALECQIYLVFAVLLIPVWRRFGLIAQLAIALALGLVPHYALLSLDWTLPWLLGLFAMGVAAASLVARKTLPRVPFGWLALAATAVTVVLVLPYREGVTPDGALWPADFAAGAAIALFFVAGARNERLLPVRLLALRPVVLLGTFSYSLYLIHGPLVDVTGAALARLHAGVPASALAYALLVPLVVAAAYAFYRVFERPFMSTEFRRAIELPAESPAATALAC